MSLRLRALRALTPAHEEPDEGAALDLMSLASLPAVLVVLAAAGILIVLVLDVRRLRRDGRLTLLHVTTSGALAALVVCLAIGFASAVLQVPSASAREAVQEPAVEPSVSDTVEVGTDDPLAGVQLPTLAE